MRRVVFFLVPQLHLLDLAGPAQVFSTAARFGHGYSLSYAAEQVTVPTAQGVELHAETTWPQPSAGDIIVVPGWRTPQFNGSGQFNASVQVSASVTEYLRDHHAAGGTVVSVCSGADLLGKAGLLDGRSCTTHHDLQEQLSRRYPKATVLRDVLYTVDDRVVTSAGIASGIDLALHLVATRHGPGVAARVAREMVVYARRNGTEHQASAMLRHRWHLNDAVHRVQDLIESEFDRQIRLDELAAASGCSSRTVTRLFTQATGMTPLRYQSLLRRERAEHLIGHGATVQTAAQAVGFTDARMLRKLRARHEDAEYERSHSAQGLGL